ncbi:hypothetical protein, partial [Segatella sp.]|uniref:hypothetical protein n=1 Tax=Segatella sp. TaxID=2974253 RepID=UPI003078C336
GSRILHRMLQGHLQLCFQEIRRRKEEGIVILAIRPERAEAPSPGQHPGYKQHFTLSPCKGKSFKYYYRTL